MIKKIFTETNKVLNKFGYELKHLNKNHRPTDPREDEFIANAELINSIHFKQTEDTIKYLKEKYQKPVFGKVRVWDLMSYLAQCIDPTDRMLYCVSQLVHTLQVVEAMKNDGIDDEDMIVAALIHDLGKILLLTGEKPENVVCMNSVVKEFEEGIGLDNCIFQWNHDEFVYDRFKDHVPENIAWVIRYHSIFIDENRILMDEKDKEYTDRYLETFSKYDAETKSVYNLPKVKLEDYRELIERYFPKPILF